MKLLGKEYSEKDDVIWKLEKDKIIWYKNGKHFVETSLINVVLTFVIENNRPDTA